MMVRRLIAGFVIVVGLVEAAKSMLSLRDLYEMSSGAPVHFSGSGVLEQLWIDNLIGFGCALLAVVIGLWWFRRDTMGSLERYK